jgi:hypothetical protein
MSALCKAVTCHRTPNLEKRHHHPGKFVAGRKPDGLPCYGIALNELAYCHPVPAAGGLGQLAVRDIDGCHGARSEVSQRV